MFWKGRATQWTSLRALRGSEGYGVCEDAARRAFLDLKCNGKTYNVTKCFSARKRYFVLQRLFFAYFFLARQKRDQTANQRSVCCLERTSSGMDETCRLRRGEGYGACEDECPRSDSCGRAITTAPSVHSGRHISKAPGKEAKIHKKPGGNLTSLCGKCASWRWYFHAPYAIILEIAALLAD